MKSATFQVSIYFSREHALDQSTDSCSIRSAMTYFQERACESTDERYLLNIVSMELSKLLKNIEVTDL